MKTRKRKARLLAIVPPPDGGAMLVTMINGELKMLQIEKVTSLQIEHQALRTFSNRGPRVGLLAARLPEDGIVNMTLCGKFLTEHLL